MRSLHEINAWVLIIANAAVGIWCFVAYRWPAAKGGPALTIGLILAEISVFTQATIGAIWSRQPGVPLSDMHALYGFSAIIAVAILYSYRTSPFMKGKELLLYGFGSWFIMGLGLRNLFIH